MANSADQILANPDIRRRCSSARPRDTHADLIIRAAQAGKHIFCEKPIAHGLAKIDALAAARSRRRQAPDRLQPSL